MASKCRFNSILYIHQSLWNLTFLQYYFLSTLLFFLHTTKFRFLFVCRSKWDTLWKTVQKLVWCFSAVTAELLLIQCDGSKPLKTGTGMFAFSMFWRHFKQALRYGHISRPCKAMALRTELEKYVKSTGMNKYWQDLWGNVNKTCNWRGLPSKIAW